MSQTSTEQENTTKTFKPSLYGVYILNDNYSTWKFVVEILMNLFHKNEYAAITLTSQIHSDGEGICGVYTKEIAQMKVQESMAFAKANKQPLQTVMREVTQGSSI